MVNRLKISLICVQNRIAGKFYAMLFLEILPWQLQIFCNVFSSISYAADLSTGLQEIANPSRSISAVASVSTERTNGSSKLDRWEDSDVRLLITTWSDHVETRIQSSAERQSENVREMVNGTYLSYRTKIPNRNFRNFYINGKQPRQSCLGCCGHVSYYLSRDRWNHYYAWVQMLLQIDLYYTWVQLLPFAPSTSSTDKKSGSLMRISPKTQPNIWPPLVAFSGESFSGIFHHISSLTWDQDICHLYQSVNKAKGKSENRG